MPDYRSMFDSDYIGAWDLLGKDVVVTISRVVAGSITGEKGRTSKKPIIYFEGKEKGLLCNKTNGKTIAALYGNDTTAWVGQRITLFPTTTTMGSETKECIRVRPRIPSGGKKAERPASDFDPNAGEVPPELEPS